MFQAGVSFDFAPTPQNPVAYSPEALIQCRVSGNPIPTVYWRFRGQRINTGKMLPGAHVERCRLIFELCLQLLNGIAYVTLLFFHHGLLNVDVVKQLRVERLPGARVTCARQRRLFLECVCAFFFKISTMSLMQEIAIIRISTVCE
jgi:hypothetical protein